MDIQTDIPTMLAELDGLRMARGLSYQDIADACGVSKSTIYRALTGQTEPTMQLIQSIAAAVQYKPAQPELIPFGYTPEEYIAYLQASIQRQADDIERRVRQLHSHYNLLRRQDRRSKLVWMVIAICLIAAFVSLFIYDFANLDRGWIQAMLHSSVSRFPNRFTTILSHIRSMLWTV